jgi:hypothetical protein
LSGIAHPGSNAGVVGRQEQRGRARCRKDLIGGVAHVLAAHADFVVFRFAKPEDAQAFAKRFGGNRLPVTKR